MKQFNWQNLLVGLALAASCMLVGALIPITNQAHGEVRGGVPEPTAFQNGSVPLLREISATLHQMDGRLARLEIIAQKMQAKATSSSQRALAQPPDDDNN